jgi:uncharacterized protein YkwD
MTHAPAAASVRFALAAFLVTAAAAFAYAGLAEGAVTASSSYVAPASACPGSADPAATPAVQQRAIACLVNWARSEAGRRSLASSRSLQRAAVLKGRGVVSCGELTHAPCGSDPLAPLRACGYRYASFGENLLLGGWREVSAREVVAAWLQSPEHRANILRAGFRDIGAALVHERDGAVWVATFGSTR